MDPHNILKEESASLFNINTSTAEIEKNCHKGGKGEIERKHTTHEWGVIVDGHPKTLPPSPETKDEFEKGRHWVTGSSWHERITNNKCYRKDEHARAFFL